MAAGDNTRAWWPQMLSEIEQRWSPELDWSSCIKLCEEMTEFRTTIRRERGIKQSTTTCKCCGGKAHVGPSPISIRSLLFALNKIGRINTEELEQLDYDWQKYQKLNFLDSCGLPKKVKNSH